MNIKFFEQKRKKQEQQKLPYDIFEGTKLKLLRQ